MTELHSLFSQFALQLESVSRQMKSVAAHPLSGEQERIGQLHTSPELMSELQMEGRKKETVLQSVAMSTGDAELFALNFSPFKIERAPDLNGLRFLADSGKKPLSLQEKLAVIDRSKTIKMIQDLFRYAAKQMAGEALTPFFQNGVQVEVTDMIQTILTKFELDLAELEQNSFVDEIQIHSQPLPGRVTESVTRGYSLPFFLAIDAKNDFDSGNCDLHINTSFRLGESVQILAESADLILIIGEGGNFGWIDQNFAGRDSDSSVEELADKKIAFYVAPVPYFYEQNGKKKILRPYDQIYESDRGEYFAQVSDDKGGWELEQIPGLSLAFVLPELDFAHSGDLQAALDSLYELRMPYTFPVDDCSSTVQGFLKLGGYSVARDSNGQMEGLREIFAGVQQEITESSQLDKIDDGLYAVNLLVPDLSGAYTSQHIFIAHVDQLHNIIAFSQAFSIAGDEGLEMPIGPHVCHRPAFEAQLNKANKQGFKRKLAWTQLTA